MEKAGGSRREKRKMGLIRLKADDGGWNRPKKGGKRQGPFPKRPGGLIWDGPRERPRSTIIGEIALIIRGLSKK